MAVIRDRYKKITLLHSNDMHGDFLPEFKNGKITGYKIILPAEEET